MPNKKVVKNKEDLCFFNANSFRFMQAKIKVKEALTLTRPR